MTGRVRFPCPKCQRPTCVSAKGNMRWHFEADRKTRCPGSGVQVVDFEPAEKPEVAS